MKFSIILILVFTTNILARPEGGYNYEPSGQIQPSGSYLPSQTSLSTSYGTPGATGISVNGFSSGFTDGSTNSFFNGFSNNVNAHQDQRQVYFFAAPDDASTARLRIYVQPSSGRNSKIIFVKAPSSGAVIPEVIAPPSQAQEKTKIYVLVKKGQNGGAITIPSSLGVKQGKPEVFFIKYRNQQEAAAAVEQGLHGGTVGSHLDNLGNEQAFVRSLDTGRDGISGDFTSGVDSAIGGGGGGRTYGTPGVSGPYKR